MSIDTDVEAAAFAYQDARTGPDTATREALLRLADNLAESALELVDLCHHLERELAAMEHELATVGPDVSPLAELVRAEHDIAHRDAWAVCGFPACRAASAVLS